MPVKQSTFKINDEVRVWPEFINGAYDRNGNPNKGIVKGVRFNDISESYLYTVEIGGRIEDCYEGELSLYSDSSMLFTPITGIIH